jgi:hypothetical protein
LTEQHFISRQAERCGRRASKPRGICDKAETAERGVNSKQERGESYAFVPVEP